MAKNITRLIYLVLIYCFFHSVSAFSSFSSDYKWLINGEMMFNAYADAYAENAPTVDCTKLNYDALYATLKKQGIEFSKAGVKFPSENQQAMKLFASMLSSKMHEGEISAFNMGAYAVGTPRVASPRVAYIDLQSMYNNKNWYNNLTIATIGNDFPVVTDSDTMWKRWSKSLDSATQQGMVNTTTSWFLDDDDEVPLPVIIGPIGYDKVGGCVSNPSLRADDDDEVPLPVIIGPIGYDKVGGCVSNPSLRADDDDEVPLPVIIGPIGYDKVDGFTDWDSTWKEAILKEIAHGELASGSISSTVDWNINMQDMYVVNYIPARVMGNGDFRADDDDEVPLPVIIGPIGYDKVGGCVSSQRGLRAR